MPSLLLGLPNKREGEQENLHTFSDNTKTGRKYTILRAFENRSFLMKSQENGSFLGLFVLRREEITVYSCDFVGHFKKHFPRNFFFVRRNKYFFP